MHRFGKLALLVGGAAALALVIAGCAGNSSPAPAATGPGTENTVLAADIVPGKFFLIVTSPVNESVVATAQVQVLGRTVPDAVVSVDGRPVEVDEAGVFSATVAMAEGPNAIDVVASDFQGNKQAQVIHVIYAQGGARK